ncbi:hypothetical protein HS088_TW23G00583 [Tripterygium wilfordii]|uniref:SAM domain-containing protein n=1 Tax=Tripterygium wilfordii TaxID=458696 RepID=A0A7J7BVE3_TRIWF|nr:uncharacterized protein LOC119993762 [Tripterygium wilfordii]KAF5725853.1 hypothetical protein HS088_TW23G00583 [Tripterygium wilfordii]
MLAYPIHTHKAMDWFSWLSKTTLEPSQVYEYGLTFARNELEAEDLPYFNHEFLHSMGISVAKHRLEILKLAKKEVGPGRIVSLSKLVWAINKTKKGIKKCVNKWGFHKELVIQAVPEKGEAEVVAEKAIVKARSVAKSGPIIGRIQEKVMATNRGIKLSGPLDVKKLQEKFMYTSKSPQFFGTPDPRKQGNFMVSGRSPMITGPPDRRSPSPFGHGENEERMVSDYNDPDSLWATLFQDMKPT